MKTRILILAALGLCPAVFSQQAPVDWQAMATQYRNQAIAVTDSAVALQVQLDAAKKGLAEAQAKVADLEKKVPKPPASVAAAAPAHNDVPKKVRVQ